MFGLKVEFSDTGEKVQYGMMSPLIHREKEDHYKHGVVICVRRQEEVMSLGWLHCNQASESRKTLRFEGNIVEFLLSRCE